MTVVIERPSVASAVSIFCELDRVRLALSTWRLQVPCTLVVESNQTGPRAVVQPGGHREAVADHEHAARARHREVHAGADLIHRLVVEAVRGLGAPPHGPEVARPEARD